MQILKVAIAGIYALGLTGCAHTHMVQGAEEKSEIPAGIRVGIGSSEVNVGDSVVIYKSVCKAGRTRKSADVESCSSLRGGEASVIKVLDHDSAIVAPQPGLVVDSEMFVERK